MAVTESAFIGVEGHAFRRNQDRLSGVSEFLVSLQGDQNIDGDTLDALRSLFKTQKLTKTRLLKSLEEQRVKAVARESGAPGQDGREP